MPRKKKPDIIPEVDVIKARVNRSDPCDKYRDDDGFIRVTRSKYGEGTKKEAISKKLSEQEEKIQKLKEKLGNIELDDKPKKKDKKGKKKKKKKDIFEEALMNSVPKDFADFIKDGKKDKGKKGKKKDKKGKKKHKLNDDGEDLLGLRVKEKKDKKSSQKSQNKQKSEVEQRFKEVEKLSKENMQEIEKTMKFVDDRIEDIMKSSDRMRGKDTALSNYFQAKSTLINSKQSAVKDILNTRTKVYDIEIKKERQTSSENASHTDLIARVFPSIVKDGNLSNAIAKDINLSGKNKDSKKKKKKNKSKGMDDLLMKREKQLIDKGELKYNVYDENIHLEGKYTVAIKKSWTDGDYKFVAVDKNNKIIDIPKKLLPKKSNCNMKFDDEKDVGLEQNTGKIYRVIPVPTL